MVCTTVEHDKLIKRIRAGKGSSEITELLKVVEDLDLKLQLAYTAVAQLTNALEAMGDTGVDVDA